MRSSITLSLVLAACSPVETVDAASDRPSLSDATQDIAELDTPDAEARSDASDARSNDSGIDSGVDSSRDSGIDAREAGPDARDSGVDAPDVVCPPAQDPCGSICCPPSQGCFRDSMGRLYCQS